MKRFVLAVVIASCCLLVSRAHAQDEPFVKGSYRAQIEAALDSGKTDEALDLIDRLASPSKYERIPARHLEAARAAMDLLPHEQGNSRAAKLLAETLWHHRGHLPTWDAAQTLRRRLLAEVDVETGTWFLGKLVTIYPNEPSYRVDLALLLLDGGKTAEARAELRKLPPSDVSSRYWLAMIEEDQGDVDAALAIYDRLIASGGELKAHWLKTKVLRHTLKRYERARKAVQAGLGAAKKARLGETRDYYVARLEEEQRFIEDDARKREALIELDVRLDRKLLGISVVWLVVLGGGVVLLRRFRLI